MLILEFKFALQVSVRLDSMSNFQLTDYSEVVFADYPIDPDVRYNFVAIRRVTRINLITDLNVVR